ncbi:hypothetical protein BaRGS_00002052 [Batillaria attramentaria]|uniref:Uncharacterized protein n=1 Tax=Batillaria attramentaria TaxID=370345 RepID=A0ABD0M5M8_9CAEN
MPVASFRITKITTTLIASRRRTFDGSDLSLRYTSFAHACVGIFTVCKIAASERRRFAYSVGQCKSSHALPSLALASTEHDRCIPPTFLPPYPYPPPTPPFNYKYQTPCEPLNSYPTHVLLTFASE